MSTDPATRVPADGGEVGQAVARIYRDESRRVLATLIRLLGDFELAEEALQDAFAAALSQWATEGLPANPRAWLVSTGRFKAIDVIRRRARFDETLSQVALDFEQAAKEDPEPDERDVEDDHLRLVFTCCHPSLASDARVALTLREVCGLTTEEIASAFLAKPATLAQRIVRAKNKIRDAGIPYEIPSAADLPARLDSVLQVVYLVFNEGYAPTSGGEVTRRDLSTEAIRLGRVLAGLLPDPEVLGLLALMLLHESRRAARTSASGDPVLLDEQDRRTWDRSLIDEGLELVERALGSGRVGPYALQAAISAVHARAPTAADTDWAEIAGLYDLLLHVAPGPVVELNRAVAIAMLDGPEAGLALVDDLLGRGELADYHLAHAARADFCRRLERYGEARAAYRRALQLVKIEPERRLLARRIDSLP